MAHNELDPAHSIIQSTDHKTHEPLEASINVVKDTSTNAPIMIKQPEPKPQ